MSRLDQLRRVADAFPHDPISHYGLGLEYFAQQQWAEAVAAFDAAIAVDAKYSTAYYHKGRTLIGAGKPDEARVALVAGMTIARQAGDWHAEAEMRELLASIE